MARHQLTFANRYRGLRTERQAADRRDRHVGICLIGLALAYSLFEIGAAIDNYATRAPQSKPKQPSKPKPKRQRPTRCWPTASTAAPSPSATPTLSSSVTAPRIREVCDGNR